MHAQRIRLVLVEAEWERVQHLLEGSLGSVRLSKMGLILLGSDLSFGSVR